MVLGRCRLTHPMSSATVELDDVVTYLRYLRQHSNGAGRGRDVPRKGRLQTDPGEDRLLADINRRQEMAKNISVN